MKKVGGLPRAMCLALEMVWTKDVKSIEAELKMVPVWVTVWINGTQDSLKCIASSSPCNLLIIAT